MYHQNLKLGKKKKRKIGGGAIQKKVLLLLLGGVALRLSGSPSKYFRILNIMQKEWANINRSVLNRAIRSLYKSRLIETRSNKNGTLTLVLSKDGKEVALTHNLDTMRIERPKQWDGYWRVVLFDVPERLKKVRESLRYHLNNMNFCEFQKSVFVHPFPCREEIEYLIEFYYARRYVRFMLVKEIDNELHLKKHFGLL